jgi:molybdopterin molybdotransferase
LKSVDEHLHGILSAVEPLQPLPLTLADAHGCVLAEDVTTALPLPPFDNSAMDGYAVRLADVANATEANPATLHVSGDLAAGSAGDIAVQPGFAVRIMTGALIPPGAEAVVPVEWTDGGVQTVVIRRAPTPAQHIRRAGDDLPAGALVLPAGVHLSAAQIGLLAAAGRASVLCRPRPRVVVISTGDELVEVGDLLGPGQIPDSNSHALTAAAREAGALAFRVGGVRDDPQLLRETLEDHLIRADAVITSGGVSVGAYDVVKEVLSKVGTVTFDKVAMQPGMPQGFGKIGPDQTPIFTLPGNPVSALVSFEVFVRPALRRMLGAEPLLRPTMLAAVAVDVRSPEGKRSFLRVRVERQADGRVLATPADGQGSHQLAGMAHANALLIVPEVVTQVEAGTLMTVVLLERRHQ